MKKLLAGLLACSALLWQATPFAASMPEELAATPATAPTNAEERAAQDLLKRAVAYYKKEGDKAFAAFSRQGEFVNGQMYVYVIDDQGVLLASGGPSIILVGRNVNSTLDDAQKAQLETAIKAAESSEQMLQAEYRWQNRATGRVDRKHVYFQAVGKRGIVVGYYLPRAEPAQAKALLDDAVKAINADPQQTFSAINNLDKRFILDDLYVFAVDMKTGRFAAHGYNHRLVGTDFKSLKDADGKTIGQPMMDLLKHQDAAEFDYRWRNPVTGKVESKHAYMRKAGNYWVAVGYYTG